MDEIFTETEYVFTFISSFAIFLYILVAQFSIVQRIFLILNEIFIMRLNILLHDILFCRPQYNLRTNDASILHTKLII